VLLMLLRNRIIDPVKPVEDDITLVTKRYPKAPQMTCFLQDSL
jgi:hypothetical protein